jgi:hypothetical protein
MAKKLYRAQVGLMIIRSVDFVADEGMTDDELDGVAGEIAMNITGGADDFQVLGIECRGRLTGHLLRAERRARPESVAGRAR